MKEVRVYLLVKLEVSQALSNLAINTCFDSLPLPTLASLHIEM